MAAAAPSPEVQRDVPPRPRARERRRVAFVCVGNSCRSQMAEGWVRHLNSAQAGTLEVEAMSAGLHPIGYITPETFQVMEEKQVSLDGQESKGLEAIDWSQVDLLVNMTGLPSFSLAPGFQGRCLQWHIEDPFGESLRVYRRVRDQLERKVKELLADIESTAGGPASPPGG